MEGLGSCLSPEVCCGSFSSVRRRPWYVRCTVRLQTFWCIAACSSAPRTVLTWLHEAARVHHPARRRGGRVADCCARAAGCHAGDRVLEQPVAGRICECGRSLSPG